MLLTIRGNTVIFDTVMTDLVILTALLPGPAYGYALKRTAGLIFGSGTLHNNIVYPMLKKFVESGWVEQSTVPGDRGQQRKQYRITAAGRKYLLEQIAEFGERESSNDGAFLFRVALFGLLPQKRRLEILAARKAHLAQRLNELDKLEEAGKPTSYSGAVLARVQDVARNELDWIAKLEQPQELEQPTRRRKHANGRVHAGI
jgi:DNA-binding PadR family transcriptional regulator